MRRTSQTPANVEAIATGRSAAAVSMLVRAELAERCKGRHFDPVEGGEVHGPRTDQHVALQTARHDPKLEWRRSCMRDLAGEAGGHAGQRTYPARRRSAGCGHAVSSQPQTIGAEGDGDGAHECHDGGGRDARGEQIANQNAKCRAGQGPAEHVPIQVAAERPDADDVLGDQYGKHDGRGLHGIDHEHHQWQRQRSDAGQPAFGKAKQDDCRRS